MSRSFLHGKTKGFQVAGTVHANIWKQERTGWLAVVNPGCQGECRQEKLFGKVGTNSSGLETFKGRFLEVGTGNTEERGMGL